MPAKIWTITIASDEGFEDIFEVSAFTEDGAMNRAGSLYKNQHGFFPTDAAFVSIRLAAGCGDKATRPIVSGREGSDP